MSARRRSRTRPAPPTPVAAREPAPPRQRSIGIALLVGILAVGAALRVWIALTDDGIFWPDEIYQSLEPAHRIVYGTAVMPWEFIEGARSWLFPAIFAALIKGLDLVGLGDPRVYLDVTRVILSAASVATAYASYRIARGLGAGDIAAVAGASVFALAALPIYLAPRALSENASALPAALGMALLLPARGSRRDRIVGAALIGLAVVLRLQNGLFAIAVLGVLLWRRRFADAQDTVLTFAAWAAAYAILDLLTWGSPFRSALLYLRVNLATPDLLAQFGGAAVQTLPEWYFPSPDYYARTLLSSMGFPFVVATLLAVLAWRRAPELAVVALAFFVGHSLIPHKELRYITPVLPLLGALAAIGIEEARGLLPGRAYVSPALAALLVLASGWSAATSRSLTFRDLGVQGDRLVANAQEELRTWKAPDASAYDDPGGVNRLLLVARGQPDLCGIKVESVLPEFQGGYTYLSRNVPLYRLGGPARASGFFNYAIALRGTEAGAEVRASEGEMVLLRLRASCATDPAFDTRL